MKSSEYLNRSRHVNRSVIGNHRKIELLRQLRRRMAILIVDLQVVFVHRHVRTDSNPAGRIALSPQKPIRH